MGTFDDNLLIEDFYIIQILLQNLNYNDGKERGQYYRKQFKNLIYLLEQQNYRIMKNQNNSSDVIPNILPSLDLVVVDANGKSIMPSVQAEKKAHKIAQFGEDYSIHNFTN